MSVAVLVTSMQWLDAINHMVDVLFLRPGPGHQRRLCGTSLERDRTRPRPPAGVRTTEPMRAVAAKLRHGWREEREAVQGLPAKQQLYHVYDAEGRALQLPPDGLVISTMLAKLLDVGVGESITVEVLEGRRPRPGSAGRGHVRDLHRLPAYMDIDALDRLMRERPSVTAVHLSVDRLQRETLFRELKSCRASAR